MNDEQDGDDLVKITGEWSAGAVAGLAALVHAIRPDWDPAGIAAVVRQRMDLPVGDVAIALVRGAQKPANDTPAAVLHFTNAAWDSQGWLTCPKHPGNPKWRTDGECGGCYSERRADPDARAQFPSRKPPSEQSAAVIDDMRRQLGWRRKAS